MPIAPKTQTVPLELVAATKRFSRYPIEGMNATSIIQPFGVNYRNYGSLGLLGHNGDDIRASTGTSVLCPFDEATVLSYQHAPGATGGNLLELVTTGIVIPGVPGSYRLRAQFMHLLKSLVSTGERVKSGQVVAVSDNTGTFTTGAHLHFGLKIEKITDSGWETVDKDNGYGGCVDPELFFPDKTYQLVPADYRYGLPSSFAAEAYKRTVTPWLRMKMTRRPTDRELNAFAYGKWAYETVTDPAMFGSWTQMTKAQFYRPPYPRMMQ